jgi:hypothetical protein
MSASEQPILGHSAGTDAPVSGEKQGANGSGSHARIAAVTPAAPFGSTGVGADRGPDGRFQRGNGAAVVVGAHSAAFWAAQESARRAFVTQVLADHGFAADDAPGALVAAAEGAAQAVLLRDAAFLRVAETGGPTSLRGRRRAAFNVWLDACDRFERLVRVLGVSRRSRPAPSVREYMAARASEGCS